MHYCILSIFKHNNVTVLDIVKMIVSPDKLLQKLDHLEHTAKVYKGIANQARQVLIHVHINELALDHHMHV